MFNKIFTFFVAFFLFATATSYASFSLEGEAMGTTTAYVIGDTEASGFEAMKAVSGVTTSGAMAFATLSEDLALGELYVAKFDMKISDNTDTEKRIVLDIFDPETSEVAFKKLVSASDFSESGKYEEMKLVFPQQVTGKYEFRVFYETESPYDLYLDKIEVEKVGEILEERYVASEFASNIGTIIDDIDQFGAETPALKVSHAEHIHGGTLQFGPIEDDLTTGEKYKAVFNLKVSDNTSEAEAIYIDVYNETSQHREYKILRPIDFAAVDVYQKFEIPFTRESKGYEFRVFYYPEVTFDLYTSYTDVFRYTELLSVETEGETMFNVIGEVVLDAEAKGGEALFVSSENQEGGMLQFGPYEDYLKDETQYAASFRLKVSDNSSTQQGIYIDVFNHETAYREYKFLSPSDFTLANEYQQFEIPFVRNGSGYEFRAFYLPESNFDFYSDNVSIIQ